MFLVSNNVPAVTPNSIQWFSSPSNGSLIEIVADSTVRYSFSDNKLSVHINHLSLSDEGNYTLVATNAGGSGSDTIFVDIQGNLIIPFSVLPSCYLLLMWALSLQLLPLSQRTH